MNTQLLQLAASFLLAPRTGGRTIGSLRKLLFAVLGMVAAAIMAAIAAVALVIGGVVWLLPAEAGIFQISFTVAGVLGALAIATWLASSNGQTPSEFIDDAMDEAFPEPKNPVENIVGSVQNVLNAFERGWQHPTRH